MCTDLLRYRFLLVGCFVGALAIPAALVAQQRPSAASQEFRYASSPLVGGGLVTSQSVFGNPGQIVTSVTGLPAAAPLGKTANLQPTSGRQLAVPAAASSLNPGPHAVRFKSPTLGMPPARPRAQVNDCDCKETQTVGYPSANAVDTNSTFQLGSNNAVYSVPVTEGVGTSNGFEPTQYQNLPPGVYMGEGVFGHPRKYVDGEPLRNMFRFLSF